MPTTEWRVSDATLEVYPPDRDPDTDPTASPHTTIPQSDILSVSVSERTRDEADQTTFDIANRGGTYGGTIESGDRLRFLLSGQGEGGQYGTGQYGAGIYGGSRTVAWEGIVRNLDYARAGPLQGELTIHAQDYVFAILSWRIVYDAFESLPVVGAETALVNRLLARYAPEISTARLPTDTTRTQTTDLNVAGENLLDILSDLAAADDALLASRGSELRWTYFDAAPAPQFTLSYDDVAQYETSVNDDGVVNDVRVDAGTGSWIDQRNPDIDAPTPASYANLTEGTRLQYKLSPGKDEIDRIELWTQRNTAADNGITVRLQRDRAGAPQNPDQPRVDLAKHQLTKDFISTDDFTTFLLPEHTLPGNDIWMLIEGGDATEPQRIGVDATGNPLFRTYYPYPIAVRVQDRASQTEYRRRQFRLKNENLTTFEAARRAGETYLQRNRAPETGLTFETQSNRAATLRPGDVIRTEFADEAATGDFIVTQRDVEVDDVTVTVTITATEVSTL